MQEVILELSKLIVPSIIVVFGSFIANYIFYSFIKDKIDKSIERHKIAYSGVFKEKVDIYKELLKKNYALKAKIIQFQHFGSLETGNEIKSDVNDFINFYLINQMFLSKSIIKNVLLIQQELSSCFEDFYMQNRLEDKIGIPSETRITLLNKFFESGTKLKTNNPFQALEDSIINEMRQDLQTDS